MPKECAFHNLQECLAVVFFKGPNLALVQIVKYLKNLLNPYKMSSVLWSVRYAQPQF